jgi:hypothetical protein
MTNDYPKIDEKNMREVCKALGKVYTEIKNYVEENVTEEQIKDTQDFLLKHTLNFEFAKFCAKEDVDPITKELINKYLEEVKSKDGKASEILEKYTFDDFIKDYVLKKALKQVCKENGLDLETEEAIRKQLKNRR